MLLDTFSIHSLADPCFIQLDDGGEVLVAKAFALTCLEEALGEIKHRSRDAGAVSQGRSEL
ncbi:hypothetical protein D3C81_2288980 [compost metagenome]